MGRDIKVRRLVNHVVIFGLSLSAVVLGFVLLVLFFYIPELRRENHLASKKVVLHDAEGRIEQQLALVARDAARCVASFGPVASAALHNVPPDSANVLSILHVARRLSDAEIVYVMDASGKVVASTRYNGSGSTLTGKSYEFRPYFTQAIAGKGNVYAALGVTTLRRGLYFAEPIVPEAGEQPVGVVVAKMGLAAVDAVLSELSGPACFLSPEGVVFASNRKDWLLGCAIPMEETDRAALRTSRQFADSPLRALGVDLSQDRVDVDGASYVSISEACSMEGWRLVLCIQPSSQFPLSASQKAIGLFLFGAFLLLSASALVVGVYVLRWRRAQKRYRDVVENMSEAVVVLQGRGSAFFNERAQELVGYTEEQLHAMDPMGLVHALDRERITDAYTALLTGPEKGPEQYELRLVRSDGSTVWVLASAVRVKWLGAPAVLAFIVDVTEHKQLKDRLADTTRMESIGQLAGGIAHDFNNLLAVIQGNIICQRDMRRRGLRWPLRVRPNVQQS